MFSIVFFEKLYKWVATLLGISDASFLIIIGIIFFLLIYVLHLSIKISEMSDKIQELISYISIIDKKMRDNKNIN